MATTRTGTVTRGSIPPGRPVWRRASLRLLRQPVLLAALALGALLVVVTIAAHPLFVSAAESQLLASTIADPATTRFGAGITYRVTDIGSGRRAPGGGSLLEEQDRTLREVTSNVPALGDVLASRTSPPVQVRAVGRPPPASDVEGRLFTGQDALQQVEVVAGHEGDGVWLPRFIATALQAHPGDLLRLGAGGRTVTTTVDGIYADLYSRASLGYWQVWSDEILQPCPDCDLPPQFILADASQFDGFQGRLHQRASDDAWTVPVRGAPPITLGDARDLAAFGDGLGARMSAGPPAPFGALFQCCGPAFPVRMGFHTSNVAYQSAMSGVVRTVDERSIEVGGPVLVLLFAGLAISLLAVAAAALFAFVSRPVEAGVLNARGWGPASVGARAALEAAIPVVAGAVAGYGLATALVSAFGPSGPVEPSARTSAAVEALAGAAGAIALVGCVSGVAYVSRHEHRARLGRAVLWLPWEILALVLAVRLSRDLRSGPAVVPGEIARPSAAVFLFPVVVTLGIAIFAARCLSVAIVRTARARGGPSMSARWLAIRRLGSSARLGAVFIVAAALAVSVFVAAQGLVTSLRDSVDTKARIFVGSDVQVQVTPGSEPPKGFPFPVTEVERAIDAGTLEGDVEHAFDAVVIDPSTFASAAFWRSGLSDESLHRLLESLSESAGTRMPIVIANGGDLTPTFVTIGSVNVPVDVVGRAISFPGAASQHPIVVVSATALQGALNRPPSSVFTGNATTELWIAGPPDRVLAAVAASDVLPLLDVTADHVKDIPFIRAAINTFLVLEILGIAALLLVVVLAIVYLSARQRSRAVASALSQRMGATGSTLRTALTIELGGLLATALVIGSASALLAAPWVIHALDPLPTLPPPPFTDVPWPAMIVAAAVLTLATVLGARSAQRAARRVPLGEVMRVDG